MEQDKALVVFQDKNIRRIWHNEEWYFSVVDIVGALSESDNPAIYWRVLKHREPQLVTICNGLKLPADDGKMRITDCVTTKNAFRLIQSIPSPKAEPFKQWLAQVGYERVQEIQDPELAQQRMQAIYEKKGYSRSWIEKRLRGIAVRQDLTEEWKERGVDNPGDFAILTAEISKASFGMTPAEYKALKGLKSENLRDHMTDLELIFTMLGEASTAELERVKNPREMEEHKVVSRDRGDVAKNARLDLENRTKKQVISEDNYLQVPEKLKRRLLKEGSAEYAPGERTREQYLVLSLIPRTSVRLKQSP